MRAILRRVAYISIFWTFISCQTESVPLEYFCTRLGHSTFKNGDAIYSFGGARNQSRFNETYPYDNQFIKLDVSHSWDLLNNDQPTTFVGLRNATNGPPPSLVDSSIFYDADDDFYVYGGGFATANSSEDRQITTLPVPDRLWTLSNNKHLWNSSTLGDFKSENAPMHALYAQAPEHDLVFLLNGILSNCSSEIAYPKMMVINTQTKNVRTVSTESVSNGTRVGGLLQYLPLLGTKGALVLFGGATRYNDNITADRWGIMEPMDTIYIFDIASLDNSPDGIWYKQRTSGRIPKPRISTCGVSVISPDGTNYHIYMASGRTRSVAYDDVWVLSLPQFRWTQVFAGKRPNYGAACQLVGKKQMLILGGVDEMHGIECGYTPYVALFDMTNLKWLRSYVKDDKNFTVPRAIYEWIEGSPSGDARMWVPEGGFSSLGLTSMFDRLRAGIEKKSKGASKSTRTKRVQTIVVVLEVVGLFLL